MSTLEQDLQHEKRHLAEVRERASRRLDECRHECESLETQGGEAATAGDTKGAAECERRAQKLRAKIKRYESVVAECVDGGDKLALEVLLARLQGPEIDLLVGEVERNRELIVQRATALLRSAERQRALRHRWGELNDKLRRLRGKAGLKATTGAPVDFRINVTPGNYAQKPDGPTYREVADLVRSLGL